ncbi:MAG: CopG family transcriptional regulator [Alphaproteobacteria bacterium]
MKRRYQFYLDGEVAERLVALAAKPGSSKTAIMTDALKAYFGRGAASELEERFKARLDKLSLQLGRIERDQQVIAETLALFVRFQLMVSAPLAEGDRAARLVGQERFKSFVEQVSRRISAGRTLTDDVLSLTSEPEAAS